MKSFYALLNKNVGINRSKSSQEVMFSTWRCLGSELMVELPWSCRNHSLLKGNKRLSAVSCGIPVLYPACYPTIFSQTPCLPCLIAAHNKNMSSKLFNKSLLITTIQKKPTHNPFPDTRSRSRKLIIRIREVHHIYIGLRSNILFLCVRLGTFR